MFKLFRLKPRPGVVSAEFPGAGEFSVHPIWTIDELRRRQLTDEQIKEDFAEVPLPLAEQPIGFSGIATFCQDWIQFLRNPSADEVLDKADLGRHLVRCVKNAAVAATPHLPSYYDEALNLGDLDTLQRWLGKFLVWANRRASQRKHWKPGAVFWTIFGLIGAYLVSFPVMFGLTITGHVRNDNPVLWIYYPIIWLLLKMGFGEI